MSKSLKWRSLAAIGAATLVVLVLVVARATAFASSGNANPNSNGYTIANNTPGFIKNAKDAGAMDPTTQMSVTVWLNLHNEAQLDQTVQALNTKGNSNYHKWLTQSQINATYSPTSQEVNSVENYLSAGG